MSNFNYLSAAVAVVNHERKSARLESTYDGLVAFAVLTPESDSARITEVARAIVLDGAHNDGTATGAALTADDLTGRDPGNVPTRSYWKAARTVRIGLVSAIKRANPATDDDDDENETDTTDYIAKVIAAVDNAVTHNVDAAAVAKAVRDHVESLLS